MSTFSASIQSSLIRCITAAVLIFCTLFPNIAVCRCIDCHCCGKADAEQSGRKESVCCSQKKTAAEKSADKKTLSENLPACCRHADSADTNSDIKDACEHKSSSGTCPCLLKANEKVPAVIEKAVSVNSTLLPLDNLFSMVSALTEITFDIPVTFASTLLFYWEHSAAPPLRLHLLLQVMVI